MLFSSNIFIYLFLPISLVGYQLLSRFGRGALLGWLSIASLFFYGYWNPAYLLLLAVSILINFTFSQMLGEGRSERYQNGWLVGAITINLALLGYYKYLFPLLNFSYHHGLLRHGFGVVTLPLGISFFTFTQIAYLIDLRQKVAERQGLLPYSLFVTFFPHLIADPIIHPREIMPQLRRLGGLRAEDLALGISWFVMGLAKKVLIADRIAPLADLLYAHPNAAGFGTTWLGVLTYSMQLYFDFSGYSDMALGLARMFSIEFPFNFKSPFKSQNIIEFWQRWHMTLSRYLNEYLYTPIVQWVNGRRMDAGKKVSRKAQATPEGFLNMVAFPLISTMFIAGIWHGAGTQYLVFGLLHGVYLTVNHGWRLLTPPGSRCHQRIPAPLMVGLTYLSVVVGMVFFRASNLHDAIYVLGTLVGAHGWGTSLAANPWISEIPHVSSFMTKTSAAMIVLAGCFLIVWAMPNTQEILGQVPEKSARGRSLLPGLAWRPSLTWCLALTCAFFFSLLLLDAGVRFLYFQF